MVLIIAKPTTIMGCCSLTVTATRNSSEVDDENNSRLVKSSSRLFTPTPTPPLSICPSLHDALASMNKILSQILEEIIDNGLIWLALSLTIANIIRGISCFVPRIPPPLGNYWRPQVKNHRWGGGHRGKKGISAQYPPSFFCLPDCQFISTWFSVISVILIAIACHVPS